jgi:uridine kinase
LDEEGSKRAFNNEYDFDSPNAIDFDVLVDRLRDLKAGYFLPVPSGSISANGFQIA